MLLLHQLSPDTSNHKLVVVSIALVRQEHEYVEQFVNY